MTDSKRNNLFSKRHIGTNAEDNAFMLKSLGFDSMDDFISTVIPANILEKDDGLIINGESKFHSAEVDSETDHRV